MHLEIAFWHRARPCPIQPHARSEATRALYPLRSRRGRSWPHSASWLMTKRQRCGFLADHLPPRPRRRPDQGFRAEPLRVGDGDEPPNRRPRHRRCRLEGARLRLQARRSSATSPPPPTSAPPTSTAASTSPAPPIACKSATRSASSPATATRPSTSTTGMSPFARAASNSFGRSPPGARFIDARRLTQSRERAWQGQQRNGAFVWRMTHRD